MSDPTSALAVVIVLILLDFLAYCPRRTSAFRLTGEATVFDKLQSYKCKREYMLLSGVPKKMYRFMFGNDVTHLSWDIRSTFCPILRVGTSIELLVSKKERKRENKFSIYTHSNVTNKYVRPEIAWLYYIDHPKQSVRWVVAVEKCYRFPMQRRCKPLVSSIILLIW